MYELSLVAARGIDPYQRLPEKQFTNGEDALDLVQ